ncbi:MAG: hypothetical protein IPH78_03590 [Bacteroidetes bacterium]|nr:hypothetical protein [Bacteroidota bacterium]
MKSITATFLFATLLTATFGACVSFAVQRHKVRMEVRKAINEEKKKSTALFEFTTKEFASIQQYDGGKEFKLQGKMYDIVKLERQGNRILVYAFFDHQETSLLDKFIRFFDDQDTGTQQQNRRANLFMPEYVNEPFVCQIYLEFNGFRLRHTNFALQNITLAMQSPPPDFNA